MDLRAVKNLLLAFNNMRCRVLTDMLALDRVIDIMGASGDSRLSAALLSARTSKHQLDAAEGFLDALMSDLRYYGENYAVAPPETSSPPDST